MVDSDAAGAMAALGRDLLIKEHGKMKEHVAQLQETVLNCSASWLCLIGCRRARPLQRP